MTRLIYLAVINLILAALMTAQAFAGVTVLFGASQFSSSGDSIWWQSIYPHQFNLRTPSLGIRYDSAINADGLSYSIGYQHLGRITTWAEAVGVDAPGDGGYSPDTKSCVNGCMATSNWHGAGTVQGVYASGVKHFGPLAFELGVYLYQPTFSMSIPDWRACRECAPIPWRVQHNPRWQLGPMLGVRYQVDNKWSVNASWWRTIASGDEFPPAYSADTYNFSLGYAF